MENLITGLITLSGGGLIVSGMLSGNWVKVGIGFLLWGIAPIASTILSRLADPRSAAADKHHAEKRIIKNRKKFHKENHNQIGDAYFKATFLFAGHIANADGSVCNDELRLFESSCLRLQLDKEQLVAARNYFNQGRDPHFDIKHALSEFMAMCQDVDVLSENFLQTQFSFAEADGRVIPAELKVLNYLSKRLNAGETYQYLLEEFRDQIHREAEEKAEQKRDEIKRKSDKKREAAEKARIEQEQSEKIAKLSPAQRKVRMAFAVLGIKPTKDKAIIKRAYREQIKRHHPDYLLGQGYPDALLAEATERSAKINKSYKLLKTQLKFS